MKFQYEILYYISLVELSHNHIDIYIITNSLKYRNKGNWMEGRQIISHPRLSMKNDANNWNLKLFEQTYKFHLSVSEKLFLVLLISYIQGK